jgi:hypothetical protein
MTSLCLHDVSRITLGHQRPAFALYTPDKQRPYSEAAAHQALTCIPKGAYGVVGFSRVKDSRKCVSHCRRFAAALHSNRLKSFLRQGGTAEGRNRDESGAHRSQPGRTNGALRIENGDLS